MENMLLTLSMLEKNGTIISDIQGIADTLGETFSYSSSNIMYSRNFQVYKLQSEKQYLNFHSSCNEEYNVPFTSIELHTAISRSGNIAVCPDKIHYSMIKNLSDNSLCNVLNMFNRIWTEHIFPDFWRLSIIIPIPKPGKDHKNPSNYRPISLTSCLCKLFERMVNRRLMYLLEKNEYFSPHQSGFRRNRSTTDNLVNLETSIREAFVRRQHLVSVFFDIEKAYDRCWRYGILRDLYEFGLRGNLPIFIKNFLQNRRFHVRMGNTLSRPFTQQEGVPQGSILSVTLFLIKINSIANCLPPSVKHSLYVDDFQISCQSSNMSFIERQLQTSLNCIYDWSKTNGFTFNAAKTSCIHFCRRRGLHLDPEIHLNGDKIPMVNEAKFLGVCFDQKLTFLPHLHNLKSRCLKSLNLLKVLCCSSWGADKVSMLRIYRALVCSKLDYSCIVYSSVRESTLRMLDPIHHQALRLCTGAFRTSPVQSLYVDAYEPLLSLRREQLVSILLYKTEIFTIGDSLCAIPHRIYLIKLEVCSISPWSTPVINVDFNLKQFPKESTPDYVYRQHFAEIQHSDRNLIPIYTDGSKSDDYVGSAFVCQDDIMAEQIALNFSIFSAELHAIYLALKYINRKGYCCCVIYTDSVSALQALNSCDPSSHSIVIKIRKLFCHLIASNFFVKFCWVPGHVGIKGNEEADAAAKAASPSQHEMCIEGGDLKIVVKKRLAERWQNVWNAQIQNKLYEIKLTIENWTCNKQYDRRSEVILSCLRIGYTRLTHQYLLNGEDQPVCEYCNCFLSVKRILCHCIALDQSRRQHFGNTSLREILGQRPNLDNIVDFLKVNNMYRDI
ncbi:uncharacterized protein LOC111619354 [Centruroides sculpturatus]|uniref:uncharacterized protein LOC111619354 n=1 Tax=Centruroides sculpturatus TaxID=218467 RepID=UPI000C6DF5A6|nr:uncharacterized protein LOC111619354 [Centruroides sculpturatus]